jgi:TolB-like protein/Tfp pilus assembly protein PilF
MSLFTELKRRNVFRVGIAYLVLGWLLLQVTDVVLPILELPEWVAKLVLFMLLIGFPLVLFFAWAFELTPDGVKREKEVDRSRSIAPETGKKLDRTIMFIMGLVIVFLLLDRFYLSDGAFDAQGERVAAAAGLPAKSIAVLPFADLSQAGDQAWFADGLAEEILNALTRTPDLLVSSRTSSFRYKGSSLDIPDIAAELGVAHVLEGSIRSGDGRIRVTAQLIRATDGFHVWSENYDRDRSDLIGIQEDLARSIATALETTMDPASLAEMSRVGTRSVQAYEQYLRGLELEQEAWNSSEGADVLLGGYEHYQRATEIDPRFAAAHYRAAVFWNIQLTPSRTDRSNNALTARQMLQEFNRRIDLAIEQAPNEVDRILYQANKAEVELRLNESIRLYLEYLTARPNDWLARSALIGVAGMASRTDVLRESLAHARQGALHDLYFATSYANDAYRVLGPSEAADFGAQLARRWSDSPGVLYQVHRTLMWAGRYGEADRIAERYFQVVPGRNNLVEVRQACAAGNRPAAEAVLERIDTSQGDGLSEKWHVLMMLDRKAAAADLLQPLEAAGVPYQLASFMTYPKFDPGPFPSVMSILEREGIRRPPPQDIPFKCPPPEETSIAVLPFVNMSTDPENEFFSDGIAEELLNVLARIGDLKVAARTSAFAFKGSDAKIADIARELGVNHVLEGSVRKAGNQVRVTAQLIKADDGFHLWSETYDRELDNIFAIQDDIAGDIADALKVSLGLDSGSSGNLTGTRSIAAYEHYLRGMSLWHLRTADKLRESIREFEAAIELDPQFAKAQAGLALAWGVITGYVLMDDELARQKAMAAAQRALELDPYNVEALAVQAVIKRYQFEFDEATALFERAISLNPSFASAYQWYGGMLGEMGDPEAGLAMYRKAWSLDPRSRIIGYNLAWRLEALGHRAEAMALADEVLGFAPGFPESLGQVFHFKMFDGDCAGAEPYGHRLAARLGKAAETVAVYMGLCQSGDAARRAAAVRAILEWPKMDFADPAHPSLSYDLDMVSLLVELDQFDAVLALFEAMPEERPGQLAWLRTRLTGNAIRFRCDPRVRSIEGGLSLPPPVRPISCN